MNHMNTAGPCKCSHHKGVPVILILIGLAFLLQNIGILTAGFVSLAWPVLLIALGAMKLKGGRCKCYAHASS